MIAHRAAFTVPLPALPPLQLGPRTLVMGIINVTPDSFADGGRRFDPVRAVEDGLRMAADGADILDVGGESTRPGAEPVTEAEELRRVLPVVQALAARSGVPVSVDTYRAAVARETAAAGASIVNDISMLRYEPALAAAVAESGAALVLMHNRGRSQTMYREARYDDVAGEITCELGAAVEEAVAAGVPVDRIVVDPGLGFAKRPPHTFEALARLEALAAIGRPILAGPSRKSFVQLAIGERPPDGREWATAAAVTACVLGGAHIVRVHGVAAMADVVRVADAIRAAAGGA